MNAVIKAINAAEIPGWSEPQPLIKSEPNKAYPIEALPDTIRRAVKEVQAYVQSPIPLVAQSAIAASAIATQTHYNVARDNSLIGPCSLFMLAVGDSGERKTSGDGYFMRAIEEHEKAEVERVKPEQQAFRADYDAWEATRTALLGNIKGLSKAGKSTGDAQEKLRELQSEEPTPPMYQRILFADATPEALTRRMSEVWPSAAVASHEAGAVLGAHGMGVESQMRNLATLCALWGGQSHTVDRATSASYVLRNPRLSVALQVQEATLIQFMTRTGQLARGSGFFARFLMAKPESTQGYRPYATPPDQWRNLEAFNSRITQLLQREVALIHGVLEPSTLHLSENAKEMWISYHDMVEAELGEDGDFRELRDSASKIADNAARLAAVFEVVQTPDAIMVSANMMERAISVATWHLYEAKRFFNEIAQPESLRLAQMLEHWLVRYCQSRQVTNIAKRDIRRLGPSPVRDAKRLDMAIEELIDANRVEWREISGKLLLFVNSALLTETTK